MDTTSDVWALFVDAHDDFASLVAQALAVHTGKIVHKGIEANLCHDSTDNLLIVDLGLSSDLTHHGYHVVLRGCLASDFALGILCEACVQNSIRDLIAQLVWE